MKRWIFALALISIQASAKEALHCDEIECSPGDSVLTYATKNDGYVACQTRELEDYVGVVLGLTALNSQVTGKPQNISPETGEPEYKGDTKQMVDTLRTKAGVNTFDEAITRCAKGVGNLKVKILNIHDDQESVWVSGADQKAFWLPKGSLTKP